MSKSTIVLILFLAALLEAGGDAIVRVALHTHTASIRLCLFLCAACVLFLYGWVVNAPPWDFGRLLGLYVVFFFVIAQLISWIGFRQTPPVSTLLGGALIISGGLVVALGRF